MPSLKALLIFLGLVRCVLGSTSPDGQVLTLDDAVKAAEDNNRAIRIAESARAKAPDQLYVARTYRLPAFSVTALGSQSLIRLGLTVDKGSLGTFPSIAPIPAKTTTLESPLRLGGILYA